MRVLDVSEVNEVCGGNPALIGAGAAAMFFIEHIGSKMLDSIWEMGNWSGGPQMGDLAVP